MITVAVWALAALLIGCVLAGVLIGAGVGEVMFRRGYGAAEREQEQGGLRDGPAHRRTPRRRRRGQSPTEE